MKYAICSLFIFLNFLPAHADRGKWLGTAQFGGSIGFLSFGGGYRHSEKLSSELLFGFVPDQFGGPRTKITYRFLWQPVNVNLSPNWRWKALGLSAFLSYNVDKDMTLVPSYAKYQPEYYWWSTALRKHLGFQTAFEYHPASRPGPKTQYYMEWNTNDLYLVNYWENHKVMGLHQIFFWGVGIRRFF
jgi:hypothetical protein